MIDQVNGVLLNIKTKEGETVKVGALLGVVTEGENKEAENIQKIKPEEKSEKEDKKITEELSDKFDKSFVILGSGMDKDILNEAEISNADILISLTNSDETNFISAAFAKSDGCDRVIALLNNKDFQGLIRSVDIGDFLDPKAITVSSILRHVRRGHIRNIYTLSDGSAEVIEGEVSSSSELVGPSIEELHLSNGLRIGGILRDKTIIMPRGDTKIKEGDYVTIFSIPEKIHEVEQLFRVSASYY